MIPTFDFSLFALLVAVGHFFVTVWRFLKAGLDWITQRALAVFLGSKFWATAAFVACFVGLFALLQTLASSVLGAFTESIKSADTNGLSPYLGFINQAVDLSQFFDVILFFFTVFGSVYGAIGIRYAAIQLCNYFNLASRAWKT